MTTRSLRFCNTRLPIPLVISLANVEARRRLLGGLASGGARDGWGLRGGGMKELYNQSLLGRQLGLRLSLSLHIFCFIGFLRAHPWAWSFLFVVVVVRRSCGCVRFANDGRRKTTPKKASRRVGSSQAASLI